VLRQVDRTPLRGLRVQQSSGEKPMLVGGVQDMQKVLPGQIQEGGLNGKGMRVRFKQR
jgi:hypothetical protein